MHTKTVDIVSFFDEVIEQIKRAFFETQCICYAQSVKLTIS